MPIVEGIVSMNLHTFVDRTQSETNLKNTYPNDKLLNDENIFIYGRKENKVCRFNFILQF